MTDERKRELEHKLDNIVAELESIVTETGYGYSIMVLPDKNKNNEVINTHRCCFIHECVGKSGLIQADETFIGVFDTEFEYDEEDEYDSEQNN